MSRKYIPILSIILFMSIAVAEALAQEPSDYVCPFVGSTNFGATNPGAVVPGGMMAVVPFNVMGSSLNAIDKDARWWSMPYLFENSFMTGFAHGALSGVGCPEMGSLLTMATSGPLEVDYHQYGSTYSAQKASPGYYSVTYDDYGIRAEATATLRSSVERYTFPAGKGNILLNLGEGLTNESGATVRRVGPCEVEGSKLLGTFCYNSQAVFPVYFVLQVSKAPSRSGYWKKQRPMTGAEADWDPDQGRYKLYTSYGRELSGDDIGFWFSYEDLSQGEQIEVRMGISYVSLENARENLAAETGPFETVRAAARDAWNSDLGRIRVSGGSEAQKKVFYTALYHTLVHPTILNDACGEYPLMENADGGVGRVEGGHNRYTVFSLWDTYRNFHQLMTLAYPERQIDMVRSMVDMYREWGWLPKWELYGRETWTMEGDPAIPVIVDTWLKGLRDFDIATAFEGAVKGASAPGCENLMRPDIDDYLRLGYVPLGRRADGSAVNDNSVSHALEYYVADAALATLADSLGFHELSDLFASRSAGWKNYYSPEYGCLRPRFADGEFLSPFDPKAGENFENAPGFHEGSAWNYSFFVPHDVEGLVSCFGSRKAFVAALQKVFDEGLYDPANEPDIAYPYLFSRFPGEGWRTQKLVGELLDKYFTTAPDGIPGNDDVGTMSAWAVFSMMGLYPDCPGEPYYTLTTPVFDSVDISLPGGGFLTIEASGTGPYIGSAALGSKALKGRLRISHDELLKAGVLKVKRHR